MAIVSWHKGKKSNSSPRGYYCIVEWYLQTYIPTLLRNEKELGDYWCESNKQVLIVMDKVMVSVGINFWNILVGSCRKYIVGVWDCGSQKESYSQEQHIYCQDELNLHEYE